jgi:hypothetical protein
MRFRSGRVAAVPAHSCGTRPERTLAHASMELGLEFLAGLGIPHWTARNPRALECTRPDGGSDRSSECDGASGGLGRYLRIPAELAAGEPVAHASMELGLEPLIGLGAHPRAARDLRWLECTRRWWNRALNAAERPGPDESVRLVDAGAPFKKRAPARRMPATMRQGTGTGRFAVGQRMVVLARRLPVGGICADGNLRSTKVESDGGVGHLYK